MTLDEVIPLVHRHGITTVLVIDDAYDEKPLAKEVVFKDPRAAAMALSKRSAPIRKRLADVLRSSKMEADDYMSGFGSDAFTGALYELYKGRKLPERMFAPAFTAYEAVKAEKREQLKPLEALLGKLSLEVVKQGREPGETREPQLVFLDLYLGVTGEAEALESAAERIARLLEDKDNAACPLIILMSTKDGAGLAPSARQLRSRAGLLGCKFRPVSKKEFDIAVPKALGELLSRYEDGRALARWLDAWEEDLEKAAGEFIEGMKMLDLSDLALLTKFRLEVEGVALADYLRATSLSYIQYCLEGQKAVAAAEPAVASIDFGSLPPIHFPPSAQIPKLKHASAFVADQLVQREGRQFDDASRRVALGDVLTKKPKRRPGPSSIVDPPAEVWVVISQACDIAQGKTDTLLLLRGTIQSRDWTTDYAALGDTTEVFLSEGRELQISWAKARISAWTSEQADQRLRVGGEYLRIARFREVEALKLQQIFASNLTRVGTLAAPHSAVPVSIRLLAPNAAEAELVTVLALPAAEPNIAPAAVVAARIASVDAKGRRKDESVKLLIFGPDTCRLIEDALKRLPEDVSPTARKHLDLIAGSPEMLLAFQRSSKVGATIQVSHGIVIATAWKKDLHVRPKDKKVTRIVLAIEEMPPQPGEH